MSRFEISLCTIDIQDNDFGYDARFRISGDFGSHKELIGYAEAVVAALNAAQIPIREKKNETFVP